LASANRRYGIGWERAKSPDRCSGRSECHKQNVEKAKTNQNSRWGLKSPTAAGRYSMPELRAYILGNDGHIIRAVEYVCPNEESAKQYAKQLMDGHDVELWEAEHPIETFRK